MDRSAVDAIVKRELPGMARALHLGHWRITTCSEHARIDTSGHIAECGRNLSYNKATLYFDPDAHDDEAEVVDSLRHELLHVVLAPFDIPHTLLVETLEGLPRKQAGAVWHFAVEQVIATLERILHDLGVPGKGPGRADGPGKEP